jgi:hypothetical protein
MGDSLAPFFFMGIQASFNRSLGTLNAVITSATGTADALIDVTPELLSSCTTDISVFLFLSSPLGTFPFGGQSGQSTFTFDPPTNLVGGQLQFAFTNTLTSDLDFFLDTGNGTDVIGVQQVGGFASVTDPPVAQQRLLGFSASGEASITYVFNLPEPPSQLLGLVSASLGLVSWLALRAGPKRPEAAA